MAICFQLKNYEEFKKVILDEYWSTEIQMQTCSQCLNIGQISENTRYREHFMFWATKLRHLETPRLTEEQIVTEITNHYPGNVRAIITLMPEKTILNALKPLGNEDRRRRIDINYRESNQPNNYQSEIRESNRPQYQRGNSYSYDRQSRENAGYRTNALRTYNPRGNNQQWRKSQQQIRLVTVEEAYTSETEATEETTEHAVNSLPTNKKSVSPYIQCQIEGKTVNLLHRDYSKCTHKKNC